MTTANDAAHHHRAATAESPPSANGKSSLRDRVRSLRLAEKTAPGKQTSLPAQLLPWGLCVILLGVTVAFGYYAYAIAPTKAAAEAEANATAAESVKTATPSTAAGEVASSGDVALEAKGYITPVHQIQVSPKVAGMLVYIDPRLEEGARFQVGDVLARIEDVDYRTTYEHADRAYVAAKERWEQAKSLFEFQVQQAEADLADARSTLAFKEDDLRRDQRQFQGRSISESDLVKAQTDAVSERSIVERLVKVVDEKKTTLLHAREAAEADMRVAIADLEKAKWNLDNCEIKAPVTGTILKKSAEKGNIVNPIAFNISASLCDMADLSDLEVDLKIQERDIAKVKKGQACVAMPEAYQNDADFLKIHPKGYTGKVSRLMPTADRGQGAIPVRVKLDIPHGEEGVYLKPDMGIIVEFFKGTMGK